MADIVEESIGRWHGIYRMLGIEVGDGKHCACPVCGGKDRFRMDDKGGRGTFICTNCGAGDGFELLKKVMNIDFIEAKKEVEKLIGRITPDMNKPEEPKITREQLRQIFVSSIPAARENPVGVYLKKRGLSLVPEILRYTENCWEPETKRNHPAMLAVFSAADGAALTMHRTYLNGNGEKAAIDDVKKLLPGLKKLTGGAIRLFKYEHELGIAEGIETAIAAYELFGIPTWSAVSSTLLAGFDVPEQVKTLHVFSDNDKNFAGQQAAYTLAKKVAFATDKEVVVHVPKEIGNDFLDELIQKESQFIEHCGAEITSYIHEV